MTTYYVIYGWYLAHHRGVQTPVLIVKSSIVWLLQQVSKRSVKGVAAALMLLTVHHLCFKKIVKLTGYTNMPATVWEIWIVFSDRKRWLSEFDGTCLKNLVKSHQVNLFLAGFRRLKPLCTGAWKWPMIEQLLRPKHDLTFDLQFIFLFFFSERANQGWRQ